MFDFQSFPQLETDRLILRETVESDAPVLFELYRDPEMSKFITFSTHADIEQTKGFIAWMADVFAKKDSVRWGIELKTANRLIGTGGLHFWKRDIQCAEVGYHIGRAYWGSGYATEALRLLVYFGFRDMQLNRIEGRHNAGNDASGRVMVKAGFQREGTWRQRELKDGVLVDVVQYSLLRSEYLERDQTRV